MLKHTIQRRVYYGDTDAIGIVYHANYLKFFEMARTESLRSIGIELPFLVSELGVQFVVVDIHLKYHKPARLDDLLSVLAEVTELGRASITYDQKIYVSDQDSDILCEARVKLVVVDKTMRPIAIPEKIRKEIMR